MNKQHTTQMHIVIVVASSFQTYYIIKVREYSRIYIREQSKQYKIYISKNGYTIGNNSFIS